MAVMVLERMVAANSLWETSRRLGVHARRVGTSLLLDTDERTGVAMLSMADILRRARCTRAQAEAGLSELEAAGYLTRLRPDVYRWEPPLRRAEC